MKKFFKVIMALAFALIPCFATFYSCTSSVELDTIQYNLNGGSFTEEYKTENNISSKNALKVANLKYYGGFSDGLADERALVAPSGKVFAGWYLDKNCTPGKYLTSQSWEELANAIRENKSNVIYARWIDAGTKDVLYEVVSDDVSFSQSFITENTTKNNMTSTTIVRFNISNSNFETEKNNLPTADDMVFSVKYEFCGWKVECNGHYYDFKQKDYNANATNKQNANVNYDFDYLNFSDFLATGNENVAYVLLRPKALENKSVNKISIALDNAYINYSEYSNFIETQKDEFSCIPLMDGFETIDDKLYCTGLNFEVRYDMSFEFISSILPTNYLMFNNGAEFDCWKFKIGDTEYDFTQNIWDENAKVKPSEIVRDVQFVLKTK